MVDERASRRAKVEAAQQKVDREWRRKETMEHVVALHQSAAERHLEAASVVRHSQDTAQDFADLGVVLMTRGRASVTGIAAAGGGVVNSTLRPRSRTKGMPP